MSAISGLDIAVVSIYALVIASIGGWTAFKQKKERHGDDPETYFLANRNISYLPAAASLFASNIGSEHFVGLAASGAANGMSVAWGEWASCYFIMLLGWCFAPAYLKKLDIFTTPEYLSDRYGSLVGNIISILFLSLYMLTKISVALYSGAILLQELLGWSMYVSAFAVLLVTGMYVCASGLKGVVWTECIQSLILVVGGLCILLISLNELCQGSCGLHWLDILRRKLDTVNAPDYLTHAIQAPNSNSAFPWTGVLFGLPYLGIMYWCCDQVIVQRVLATKSPEHALAACSFAAYLKILPPFIMIVPGIIARALYPEEVAATPNRAFPLLVNRLLPPGLFGLVVAAMLAALMSSLASVFNSIATIWAMDFRQQSVSRTSVSSGRMIIFAASVFGLVSLPLVDLLSDQVYVYSHKIMAYAAPPVTVVFVSAIYMKRSTSKGAKWTLFGGLALGLLRLLSEIGTAIYERFSGSFTHGPLITFAVDSNFLHFAAFSGFVCVLIILYYRDAPGTSYEMASDSHSPSILPSVWTRWEQLCLLASIGVVCLTVTLFVLFR